MTFRLEAARVLALKNHTYNFGIGSCILEMESKANASNNLETHM